MAYRSPIGLNRGKDRQRAREIAVYAAMVGYRNRGHMIYSELSARWSGIDDHRLGYKGEFPSVADCSAFVTWAEWNAFEHFRIKHDFVNGEEWREGYTVTMVEHGLAVHLDALLQADAIFYGGTPSRPQHTAIYVGHGRVVSHGHPGGPLLLPLNLDNELPIVGARRYIR